jgi:hypothetical protein
MLLVPIIADALEIISWNDRLDYTNHVPAFMKQVTGVVDTFHLPITNGKSRHRHCYNGKYKCSCVKFIIASSFLGEILFCSGPFLGTKYDGHIWQESARAHPTLPGEYLLGDGHFASQPDCIAPYPKPRRAMNNAFELRFNAVHAFYRSRAEHANARIRRHSLFRNIHRGRFERLHQFLGSFFRLQCALQNIYNLLNPPYPPCGNQSHF